MEDPGRVMQRNPFRGAVQSTGYHIVVRGELSQRYSNAFDGMTLVARDGLTTISGPVVDQAQLHGLLDRVGELGLELVSVNAAVEATPPASSGGR
jgi:hypothetical protein